ncbi:MAG: 5,6-dimethylbenzimidazole synthase [Bryobacteraceae bacterium]
METPPRFDETFRQQLRELLTWRRDVRRFRRHPLPQALVDELISLAHLAPSVGLSQPWRFVLVENPERRAAIRRNFETANAEALAQYEGSRAGLYARLKLAGLEEAPVHLAVCADPGTTQGQGLGRGTMPETIEYSVVTAVHTLWLAARANEVGVGWVSILDPAAVLRALDLPPKWVLIAYLCLGYPEAEQVTPELEEAGWEIRAPVTILKR